MKLNTSYYRLIFTVLAGLLALIGSEGLHAGENLIGAPGFEEVKDSMSNKKYPLGKSWREVSAANLRQTTEAAEGHDSEVSLKIAKTEGLGTYHRIVNDLHGVTLTKGVNYRFQFDYYVENEIPKRLFGVMVGISLTGGGRQNWDGNNYWIQDVFATLDDQTVEETGKWVTSTIRFTPTEDYVNPSILISENWWCETAYAFRFDNFQLVEVDTP